MTHPSIMLTGAPATGKSTVMRELGQYYSYVPFPDITTRPIRDNEIDGVDKRFVVVDEFIRLHTSGQLIESSLKECKYQGHYYGSPIEWLDSDRLGSSKILTCPAVMIAQRVRERNKNIIWVHLEAEPTDRAYRLASRGLPPAVVADRLDNIDGDSHLTPPADLILNTSKLPLQQIIHRILEAR